MHDSSLHPSSRVLPGIVHPGPKSMALQNGLTAPMNAGKRFLLKCAVKTDCEARVLGRVESVGQVGSAVQVLAGLGAQGQPDRIEIIIDHEVEQGAHGLDPQPLGALAGRVEACSRSHLSSKAHRQGEKTPHKQGDCYIQLHALWKERVQARQSLVPCARQLDVFSGAWIIPNATDTLSQSKVTTRKHISQPEANDLVPQLQGGSIVPSPSS